MVEEDNRLTEEEVLSGEEKGIAVPLRPDEEERVVNLTRFFSLVFVKDRVGFDEPVGESESVDVVQDCRELLDEESTEVTVLNEWLGDGGELT